jgi:succinate dehydrogenase / fumarate reductase cytochrome b subunit
MATLVTTLTEGLRYRGREGQWSWVLHRVSGLGTLLFLTIHILDTATVYFVPQLYSHAIDLYRHWLFGIGEIILVACVIYHGLNGLRMTLFDWKPEWMIYQRQAAYWVYALFFLLFIPAAIFMGNTIIQKSILGR